MKIVFIGTVEFSYSALKTLLENKFQVVGVLTHSASSFNSDFKDLTPLCQKYDVPLKYTNDINASENISFIESFVPDIIYCFGWSQIIKQKLLNVPKLGVVGFHPAELPKNRGRHPIIWALVLGLKQTASTFFFMDSGADSGDIISQKTIPISDNDDARSLYDKITRTALLQITTFTKALIEGNCKRTAQDNSAANIWRKRSIEDGRIDFRMSAKSINALVRALTYPYPGAHYETKDNYSYKIWKTTVLSNILNVDNIEYGKVLHADNNSFVVKCGEGVLKITEHEFPCIPKIGEYL